MKRPLVSIIIPNYNMGNYIKEAIDSALNQTYKPIEVIVVDDGSTDYSKDIIKTYGKRIRSFFNVHAGVSRARNVGIKFSNGEYIQFLDSDDILLPTKIEKQIGFLAKNFSCNVVFSDMLIKKEKGRDKYVKISFNTKKELFSQLLIGVIPTPVSLYEKNVLLKVNGFRENLYRATEYDLNIRLALKGFSFCYLALPSAIVRRTNDSNRISIKNLNYHTDPFFDYNLLEFLFNYAKKEGKNTKTFLENLGLSYFREARKRAFFGYYDVAYKYFLMAKKYSTHPDRLQPLVYRFIYNIFGFNMSEKFGRFIRCLKR